MSVLVENIPGSGAKHRSCRAKRCIFRKNVETQKRIARAFLLDPEKRQSFLNPVAIASMEYLVSNYTSNSIFVANPIRTKEADTPCIYYEDIWYFRDNLEQEVKHSSTVHIYSWQLTLCGYIGALCCSSYYW